MKKRTIGIGWKQRQIDVSSEKVFLVSCNGVCMLSLVLFPPTPSADIKTTSQLNQRAKNCAFRRTFVFDFAKTKTKSPLF